VTVLLLPSLIGPLLGGWERWVAGASPVAAMQKLSQSSDAAPDAVGSLGAWPSLLLVCGYVLAALVGAGLVFRRRDA
jgi:ABC-2 type transport system permease protein